MNDRNVVSSLALFSLLAVAPVYAAEPAGDAEAVRDMPVVMAGAGERMTSVVEAIDLDNRIVTLRNQEGELVSLQVGEEARNLPQLEVGDRVTVTIQIGLAMALTPATDGMRERVDNVTLERTELGQKPGGTLRKTVRAKAVVRAIDQETRMVTLQGAKQTVFLKVADDLDLANVKIGDEVEALYQESLAISVEPAPQTPAQ